MEVGTEQDYYEFERLLGEIPNATSGNPHPEESVTMKYASGLAGFPLKEESRKSYSPGFHTSPAGSPGRNAGCQHPLPSKNPDMNSVHSSQNTFDQQFQTNGNIDGRKKVIENGYHSPIGSAILEGSDLTDDQSLASALAQMNLKDRVANREMSPRLVNFKNMPKGTLLREDKYKNHLKKPHTSSETQNIAITSPRSPNIVKGPTLENCTTDDQGKFEVDVQDSMKRGNWSSQQLSNLSGVLGEQRQCLPVYSGATPFQLLPSNYVPAVDFSVVPYPQQYFLNAQTPTPYMQPQQMNRSQNPWQNMEEERYYRLQQQYYMQQFRDQVSEAHFPFQRNVNMTTRSLTGNARQPYLKNHNPHQAEQTNDDDFWDNASVQVLDKMRRNTFPEKILTKSQGLNLLKVINASSIGSNKLISHNEKAFSNDHFRHQSSILNSGPYHLDDCISPGSSPDCGDLKMYNLRSQPLLKFSSLDEVLGKIYLIAKDQNGCRFLQKKFAEGFAEDVDKIFVEIIGHIVELMTDPFGNYLVQKLLEVCTKDQKMQILHAITSKPGDLVRISLDMHGTRAVQKVIETLETPEQFNLVVSSLKPGIVNLMKDTNGNHVAQRCLQHLLPEYKEFLFEDAIAHCSKLAKDRHACCVLQKCLSHFDGEHKRRLVCGITSDALSLSQNQYGNYVVQFVFELRLPWATVAVLDRLEGSYGYLSMQKYSSNVVEKCLKFAGDDRRPRIVQELVTDSRLDQILQDPYGNYVVQAALSHSKGATHVALVEAIRPHVPALRTSPYGKKILSSNGLKK